jgi:hypothetical protein
MEHRSETVKGHHVPADCAECVHALIDPAWGAQCGHPEALLMAKFGYTEHQAAAWATTMSLKQIIAASW